MLGRIDSQECVALMRLIETQSGTTLAAWAVGYAKDRYLGIYEEACPDDLRLRDTVSACEAYLEGRIQWKALQPLLKGAGELPRGIVDPVVQAAARAVSTACAAVRRPTNALGFLFYGAAAVAYREAGLAQPPEIYDSLASEELGRALDSLRQASVPDEPHPVKIQWNC